MRILFVGGDFNDEGGRPSGYFQKFAGSIIEKAGKDCAIINGGYFSYLHSVLYEEGYIESFDVIVWFANVPNDKPKLVNLLKKMHPKCLLMVSKNNIDGKYETIDLIGRALAIKANLFVEFTKAGIDIRGTLLDPLGNQYVYKEQDISRLASITFKRLSELRQFTRRGTGQRFQVLAVALVKLA